MKLHISSRSRELLWIVPFVCVAMIALVMLRPLQRLPLPAHYRIVVDERGKSVPVALPFRGIALTPTNFVNGYLEDTRAPELLVYANKPSGVMSWVYPDILRKENLWTSKLYPTSPSPFTEMERLIYFDPSVYVGCPGSADLVESIGLPAFNCSSMSERRYRATLPGFTRGIGCGTPLDLLPENERDSYGKYAYFPDAYIFPALRGYSALINFPEIAGHPEHVEPRIDAYCKLVADLQSELQPSALTDRPRVLAGGTSGGTLVRAGMINAAAERDIPGDDDERVLVMDPDMILMPQGNPREMLSDPRWQGLKAVQNKRVYRRPGMMEWWAGGLTFMPIETRWMAELAHPDRLQPKVRQILRDRMMSEFGYRLSEEQIDEQLHVADNANSVGAERFTRGYEANQPKESAQ